MLKKSAFSPASSPSYLMLALRCWCVFKVRRHYRGPWMLAGLWLAGVVAEDKKWMESRSKENLLTWKARPPLSLKRQCSRPFCSLCLKQPQLCAAKKQFSTLSLSWSIYRQCLNEDWFGSLKEDVFSPRSDHVQPGPSDRGIWRGELWLLITPPLRFN